MEPRLADHRFVWTVFPGVDLVALQAPGMVAIFYMLRPCDLPVPTWRLAGLALTVGEA
ncbi:hypothetical protein [Polyangium sp. 6x1]|uniref:hypothetical protein n=1 Tax=Polyangium sp. 6x1 TaxID=3042689 RepID=UPI002482B08E|nr:hypothetical protein [Polyangium sp. 6x1]MDI1450783.1 hypothetical protein [Polyangium sp. 6x1]